MTRHADTVPPDYFTNLYATNPDPWNFETSAYETAKYDATLAGLSRPTYDAAVEIGCSIGVLTRRLAPRCRDLLSLDVAAPAIAAAAARCADQPHVRFAQMVVPGQWPEGRFDLVMLSEVLYFFSDDDMAALMAHLRIALVPEGEVVLVNFLGETHYPNTGDGAAEAVIALGHDWLDLVRQERTERYRLDVLRRRPVTAPVA
ncbi:SAM-dependent methyltransferase [Methylobacterium sp. Leaf466]|uniref:SAM-dependent methyltransferase n=1 Tax=Methylobacterium sp. Leaf466 TaxID=1736386 RepID=UPI0007018D22|nr:SAM-dependent methyltransferase [Methylobacterium sp. Leaf466]KQT77944.1 methyltransferase type 12 [Methylobacterium sp. Leaf466]